MIIAYYIGKKEQNEEIIFYKPNKNRILLLEEKSSNINSAKPSDKPTELPPTPKKFTKPLADSKPLSIKENISLVEIVYKFSKKEVDLDKEDSEYFKTVCNFAISLDYKRIKISINNIEKEIQNDNEKNKNLEKKKNLLKNLNDDYEKYIKLENIFFDKKLKENKEKKKKAYPDQISQLEADYAELENNGDFSINSIFKLIDDTEETVSKLKLLSNKTTEEAELMIDFQCKVISLNKLLVKLQKKVQKSIFEMSDFIKNDEKPLAAKILLKSIKEVKNFKLPLNKDSLIVNMRYLLDGFNVNETESLIKNLNYDARLLKAFSYFFIENIKTINNDKINAIPPMEKEVIFQETSHNIFALLDQIMLLKIITQGEENKKYEAFVTNKENPFFKTYKAFLEVNPNHFMELKKDIKKKLNKILKDFINKIKPFSKIEDKIEDKNNIHNILNYFLKNRSQFPFITFFVEDNLEDFIKILSNINVKI